MQYRCTLCQFVYDSEEGAPEAAIAKDTEFADLPEAWVWPRMWSHQRIN